MTAGFEKTIGAVGVAVVASITEAHTMTTQNRIDLSSDPRGKVGGGVAKPADRRDRLWKPRSLPGRGSCLANMAERAMAISPARLDLLGLLLATTVLSIRHRGVTSAPVWIDEAMHRADGFIRLSGALGRYPAEPGEQAAVGALAAVYAELDTTTESAPLACSEPLRTAVRSLVELFAPMIADMRLRTAIERLALPAEKRRALVLVACKLVIDALEDAAHGSRMSALTVILTHDTSASARLRIARTMFGPPGDGSDMPSGLVFGLAAVLQGWPTIVVGDQVVATEIVFPLTRPSGAVKAGQPPRKSPSRPRR